MERKTGKKAKGAKLEVQDVREERDERLRAIFAGLDDDVKAATEQLVEEAIAIERKLDELRGLPMIRVHPGDPCRQRATPAAKLYKDYVQQYQNIVKLLLSVLRKNAPEEESPLRQWLNERKKRADQHET